VKIVVWHGEGREDRRVDGTAWKAGWNHTTIFTAAVKIVVWRAEGREDRRVARRRLGCGHRGME
jgi:hypothetical protein